MFKLTREGNQYVIDQILKNSELAYIQAGEVKAKTSYKYEVNGEANALVTPNEAGVLNDTGETWNIDTVSIVGPHEETILAHVNEESFVVNPNHVMVLDPFDITLNFLGD